MQLSNPSTEAARRSPWFAGILSAALAIPLLLAGCATAPLGAPADRGTSSVAGMQRPPTARVIEKPRWWYLRFRFARAADGEVNSYLDLLVADRILAPIIAEQSPDVVLWRFHRRWPDDATGHQFSYLVFAPQAYAEAVAAQVGADPLLEQLRDGGYLREFRLDGAAPDRAVLPGGSSDLSWSPAIQAQWPTFIMGASAMWLGLIRTEVAEHPEGDLHARYRATEAALDRVWFEQAGHAFFHHLSALFGYKPVRVIRPDVMTF